MEFGVSPPASPRDDVEHVHVRQEIDRVKEDLGNSEQLSDDLKKDLQVEQSTYTTIAVDLEIKNNHQQPLEQKMQENGNEEATLMQLEQDKNIIRNISLVSVVPELKEPPLTHSICHTVALTPVCWHLGHHRKCTAVWPDVLIHPDSEMQ